MVAHGILQVGDGDSRCVDRCRRWEYCSRSLSKAMCRGDVRCRSTREEGFRSLGMLITVAYSSQSNDFGEMNMFNSVRR